MLPCTFTHACCPLARHYRRLGICAMASSTALPPNRRIEAKIQERWDRQAQRAKRWDAAFRVLHVELESMKAALGEFVRGMEEGEGARSGGAIASEA